ncbi:MAG TPA: helicase-related protein, partial [Rhodothermales bacterium]|nr:helicase-related protein [Rhodothermales bacterium]
MLAVAARGFGPFVQRLYSSLPLPSGAEPPIRLLVNEELQPADVRALTERRDTSKLEALLAKRLVPPQDLAERRRFELLAWLVKEGLLEVRVGVMRSGVGILHAKFGLIYDGYGDALVFAGSGNESAQGLQASFEQVEVSGSWSDPERYARFAEDFETLWADTDPFVHTLPLPEAVRLKLIRYAPAEPPLADRPGDATVRQRAAMLWRFVASAPYLPTGGGAACDATALVDLWPHQGRVVRDTAEAWPDGRLLCDEVGMGKTVEAILTIRRLIAGRGVRRALLLLPAGLTLQWQGELREKGGLRWPRFENPNKLVWPDGREETATLAEALRKPFLLLSRETARSPENRQLLLQAKSWDLVLLDEAHAARRANQKEGEFNHATLLLELLRRLQLERRARGLMLLSATPMQTHPWEPWDLLTVLGEGGEWLADFGKVRAFYGAVAGLERGLLELSDARTTAALLHNDLEFPPYGGLCPQEVEPVVIERRLTMAPPGERPALARWLRHGSPLGRRMHRNTRATLRTYYQRGLLDQPPPRRVVDDIRFDFADRAEREVYEAVKGYIDRRFAELEGERPGKGFVMTIYRRRAASSPRALEMSLARRAEALEHVASRHAPDILLGLADVPEALDPDELPEELAGQVEAGLPTSPAAARRELEEVEALLSRLRRLNGADTKRERFFDALRRLTDDGRPALVFSEYVDTMDYLREQMVARYSDALACYSGRGGEVYEGGAWQPVSKAEITRRLRARSIQVLLCTDAASEGLNLQAASALVCFDLPWNPSRVEQRIGRIDRIGQEAAEVRITNLFLKDSIDDRVYSVLRERCQLFEAFVGPMQPVLARARRMLIGNPQDA